MEVLTIRHKWIYRLQGAGVILAIAIVSAYSLYRYHLVILGEEAFQIATHQLYTSSFEEHNGPPNMFCKIWGDIKDGDKYYQECYGIKEVVRPSGWKKP